MAASSSLFSAAQAALRLQAPRKDGLCATATAFLLFTLITHLSTLSTSGSTTPLPSPKLPLVPAARFIASKAAALWMVRLSSILYAFGSGDQIRTTTPCSWKRSAAAAVLHAELLAAAFSSVIPMLRSLPAPLLPLAAAACICLAPALLKHSEVACRLGPVVAVAEQEGGGWRGGAGALMRAERVVEGRKVEGFLLAAAATALERVVTGQLAATSLVGVPVHLAVKFVAYFTFTAFYHDCRRRRDLAHDKSE